MTAARRLATPTAAVGWGVLGIALAGVAFAPTITPLWGYLPLLIGIVLIGLPHGALDHLVPARAGFRWGRTPTGVTLYLLAYAGVAAAYLGLWTVLPVVAFLGFLLATVWHWGQGDMRFLEIFFGRTRSSAASYHGALLFRGLLPIAVPVLAHPGDVEHLLVHAAGAFGLDTAGVTVASPTWQGPAALALLVTFSLMLGGLRCSWPDKRGVWLDVGEVTLLAVFFTLVPAYPAIGIYFIAWHSLRHLARLLLLRPTDRDQVAGGHLRWPIVRLTRDLTPITLAAIGLLLALYLVTRQNVVSTEGFVALYLVWISALTMPHLVVVALMDHAPQAPKPPASR